MIIVCHQSEHLRATSRSRELHLHRKTEMNKTTDECHDTNPISLIKKLTKSLKINAKSVLMSEYVQCM